MDPTFDRFAMFVSTEFFVQYWHLLAGAKPSAQATRAIQWAGRRAVDDFMKGEKIYWNIDFSPDRQMATANLYSQALRLPLDEDRLFEAALQRTYCRDHEEQVRVDFALGFLHRVVNDRSFRRDAGVSDSDAEALAACIPGAQDDLEGRRVVGIWLRSKSAWDQRIRNLTPDLPDYVATNFLGVRRETFQLPTLVENLATVVDPARYASVLNCLRAALLTALSSQPKLGLPLVLRAAES